MFARRVFKWAGIYGILVLFPMYFIEERIGRDHPLAITHPEHYYGFVGVALAWQILFLLLARDPVRFRPLMIPCVLEKLGFGVAVPILFALGRTEAILLGPASIDLLLAGLFAWSYVTTPSVASAAPTLGHEGPGGSAPGSSG